MNAKNLFFRNLSSAIVKRFDTPFAASAKPKKEVVKDLIETHFSDDASQAGMQAGAAKTIIEEPTRIEASKSAIKSFPIAENPISIESSKDKAESESRAARINPRRMAQLEDRIKKAINPQIEAKRRMADLLLNKIAALEKTLKQESMPSYDRRRLQKIIDEKKSELLQLRSSTE